MIAVGIASLNTREKQLIKTVESLVDQVDIIYICLNNYTSNPFQDHPKVKAVISDNRFGDAGKFLFLEEFEGYYFSCDDDIQYNENYIQDTIKEVDKYGVVSYHGRSFVSFPIDSYYKSPAIRNRCLDSYSYTEPIQIAGTGVMAFDTSKFKPPFNIFKKSNMSDIWISCYAKENNIAIWGLAHEKGYFKYQEVPNTIYDEKVFNCEYETKIVNNYFFI